MGHPVVHHFAAEADSIGGRGPDDMNLSGARLVGLELS
jgi:hypothetical protein